MSGSEVSPDPPSNHHGRWRVDPLRDLAWLALALAGTLAVLVEVPPPACLPSCAPPAMNGLDRLAIGAYAAAPLMVANALLVALALALLALHLRFERGADRLRALLVFAQAIVGTQALVQLSKFAVDRAAPFVYVAGTPPEALASPDAARSFVSGHSASALVLATLVVMLARLHLPDGWPRRVIIGAAVMTALAVGPLKVAAGYHYWTDVIAGALVGVAIGVLVVTGHREGRGAGSRRR